MLKSFSTINATITLKVAKPEVAKFVEEHNQRIKVYKATLNARATTNKKLLQIRLNSSVKKENI